jgi:hypothetical protein
MIEDTVSGSSNARLARIGIIRLLDRRAVLASYRLSPEPKKVLANVRITA